jgi:hypothetical protein
LSDMKRREFISLLGDAIPVAEGPAGYVDRILRGASRPTSYASARRCSPM